MSTELTQTEPAAAGSQALTVVSDVADNLQLVACDAEQMRVAQSAMSEWFRNKIELARRDAAELEEELKIARANGFKTSRLERHARIARRRVGFYEKCQAASEAGYVVVPNMPADVFAVRTTKDSPDRRRQRWRDNRARTNAPDLGDGRYVDGRVYEGSAFVDDPPNPVTGEARGHREYWQAAFDEEIEFPISITKPAIMTATAKAMALKCFDEIRLCGNVSDRKGDPIVLGCIRRPTVSNGGLDRISFLIAWYVDTAEL